MTKNELDTAFIHIKNWMDTRHLTLNSDKTEYILLDQPSSSKEYQESHNDNRDLKPISHVVKYFRGYFDQSLSFKEHMKQKAKKVMSNLVKIG